MSRKPVNEVSALQTRAALWKAMRRLTSFTLRELQRETRCSAGQTREYVVGLANAGILTPPAPPVAQGGCPKGGGVYTLARDLGIEPPRVRRDGTACTQGLGREQMWRTMRMLKDFTALDLSVQASTEEAAVGVGTAKEYCKFLVRGGYLVVIRAGQGTGEGGVPTLYRFIQARNTGPLPPMIQRVKQLFDPNLGQVVWSSDPADAEAMAGKEGEALTPRPLPEGEGASK